MKNIALIGTPGHYFNLLECIEAFNLKKRETVLVLFNFSSDTYTNSFFDTKIKIKVWQEVYRVSIWELHRKSMFTEHNLIRFIKYLLFALRFIGKTFDNIIANQVDVNYYKFIISLTKYGKIISMDEGNAVFSFLNKRYKNRKLNSEDCRFKQNAITFFSAYNIDVYTPDVLVKCNYRFSKKILETKFIDIDKEKVLFIGSPYVEDGLLDKDTFYKNINNISNFYQGKTIIYLSHRRELKPNLDVLKNKYGFIIISVNEPVELYLISKKNIPGTISGFYSAALLNIKRIFEDYEININSHFIEPKLFLNTQSRIIEMIYKQYNEEGMNIVK